MSAGSKQTCAVKVCPLYTDCDVPRPSTLSVRHADTCRPTRMVSLQLHGFGGLTKSCVEGSNAGGCHCRRLQWRERMLSCGQPDRRTANYHQSVATMVPCGKSVKESAARPTPDYGQMNAISCLRQRLRATRKQVYQIQSGVLIRRLASASCASGAGLKH